MLRPFYAAVVDVLAVVHVDAVAVEMSSSVGRFCLPRVTRCLMGDASKTIAGLVVFCHVVSRVEIAVATLALGSGRGAVADGCPGGF